MTEQRLRVPQLIVCLLVHRDLKRESEGERGAGLARCGSGTIGNREFGSTDGTTGPGASCGARVATGRGSRLFEARDRVK